MKFEIIDFHTHPFINQEDNLCFHQELCGLTAESFPAYLASCGVSRFCGAVVGKYKAEGESDWDHVRRNNDAALKLRNLYGDTYIPGFHIHPDYVEESIAEMHRMKDLGIRLIGQLIPSYYNWNNDYTSEAFSTLLDEAERLEMVVSLRVADEDAMDALVKRHPNLTIVAAHPGEYNNLMRHIDRMKLSPNYYLDLSGVGITRYGALKRLVEEVGADRLLYGSNFPSCEPTMFIGAVLRDRHVTENQKAQILSRNTMRLLQI